MTAPSKANTYVRNDNNKDKNIVVSGLIEMSSESEREEDKDKEAEKNINKKNYK